MMPLEPTRADRDLRAELHPIEVALEPPMDHIFGRARTRRIRRDIQIGSVALAAVIVVFAWNGRGSALHPSVDIPAAESATSVSRPGTVTTTTSTVVPVRSPISIPFTAPAPVWPAQSSAPSGTKLSTG
ncbi:MAG TPA: hypothetical protein VFR41_14355, partial [Acidimicrobiia bacterium]|nr:hypothetical protein [Acidimicrobiia bacterium]